MLSSICFDCARLYCRIPPGLFHPGLSGSFRAFVCHSTAPGLLPPRAQHSPSNAHAYRLCFVKDRYFIPARPGYDQPSPLLYHSFLAKTSPPPTFFFQTPLLIPFLALDHAPAPVCPGFWPGAVTVAWLAQAGEDRPAHPENSAAMRRHRRLQGIDEQARNVAPRLFLYLLKAGRAGDIDSGHAVADHTSNPASNSPRRCSTRPSAAAISRSRADNGRATPFPPVARLPRTSRPWGMRARQKGTGLPPMMSTRLPPSTISGKNFCTTTLRASWRSVGWVAGQADVLHPGAYFAAALPHDVLRFAHCQGVAT